MSKVSMYLICGPEMTPFIECDLCVLFAMPGAVLLSQIPEWEAVNAPFFKVLL